MTANDVTYTRSLFSFFLPVVHLRTLEEPSGFERKRRDQNVVNYHESRIARIEHKISKLLRKKEQHEKKKADRLDRIEKQREEFLTELDKIQTDSGKPKSTRRTPAAAAA